MLYAFRDEVEPLSGSLAGLMAWAAGIRPPTGWLMGVSTVILVAITDSFTRPYGVRCLPLYVPLVCLAGWTLQPRSGMIFATGTALMAMTPDLPAMKPDLVTGMNLGLHLAVYLILAKILGACRRSFEVARVLASLDSLTQLLNKGAFHRLLTRLLGARRQSGDWLCIGFIDLDDFKAVNSRHGHAAGDDVLRCFARAAIANIRRGDLIGRVGGDEFAIAIRVSNEHHARSAARSLHGHLADALAGTTTPATCSIGVVILPPDLAVSEPDLIAAADHLMYRIKAMAKGSMLTRNAADALEDVRHFAQAAPPEEERPRRDTSAPL